MNSSRATIELPLLNPFATRAIRAGALPYWDPGQQQTDIDRRFAQAGFRGAIVGPHGSGKTTLLWSLADRWVHQFAAVRWLTILRTPAGLQLAWHFLEGNRTTVNSTVPAHHDRREHPVHSPPSAGAVLSYPDSFAHRLHSPPSAGESRPQDAGGEGESIANRGQLETSPRPHRAVDPPSGRVKVTRARFFTNQWARYAPKPRAQFFAMQTGEDATPNELWIVDGYDALPWRDRWGLAHFCRRRRIALAVTSHRPTNLPILVRTIPSLATFLLLADRLQRDRADRVEPAELEVCYRAAGGNLREAFFLAFDKYRAKRGRSY